MGSILLHSGTLVCMDGPRTIVRGDLLVRDSEIVAIGSDVPAALAALPGGRAETTIDAGGAFVLPGFVHGHLHLCQTLFRGRAEQGDLLRWLREAIWPLEAAHTPESLRASADLGLLELIAGGVTCVNDMGTVRHGDALGEALEQGGIRATFGKAMMDAGEGVPAALKERTADSLAHSLALADRWHGAAGGRLRVSLAPRFILSCSEALWREAAAAAAARGLVVHTHLAESPTEQAEVQAAIGATATRYLAARDVLGPRFVGAHGVHVDMDELALLRAADAALVHCPGSNLKLGSGIAHVARWRDAGLKRGLGSDGAACDNRLDTFHELSLAGALSRVDDRDRPLTAADALALATCEGARALGLGEVTGSLERGKQADVIVVDHRGAHLQPEPERDPCVALVHAARASDVRITIAAGQVLWRDGAWTTLERDRVLAHAAAEARALFARAEPA